eukprot:CAMPEP_0118932570 /NCGR_PEP_ID=MMETSP1169-20130426/10500_1 /TAXON_ID=36882 /ORGANISM="Pyramimonas obovata, Strain CCMP722" /LENGTH=260 /DNA_ID=CAMNT_0006875247 /DNA_START=53 /DNA_END=835 /DNA_ORIENTATION=+
MATTAASVCAQGLVFSSKGVSKAAATKTRALRTCLSKATAAPTSRSARLVVRAAQAKEQSAITGLVFEQGLGQLETIPTTNEESFARQHYHPACEAALNDQLNTEYNVSYIYHAMFAYFDRDNVALPGLAKYFKEASVEEREHAEMMMEYQNMRGGRVKLQSIIMPDLEFGNTEKGDALYAMELTLSLEKLNNEKLLALHKVAEECDDPQMTDFIEGTFLEDQVEAIKKVSEMVSQLRRVGKGHGTWAWDQELLEDAPAA